MFFYCQNAASEEIAKYIKSAWKEYITQYDYEEFSDLDIKRRLKLMSTLGTSALEDDRFAQVSQTSAGQQTFKLRAAIHYFPSR